MEPKLGRPHLRLTLRSLTLILSSPAFLSGETAVHFFEPRAVDVGVDLRRRDIGVAEHGLHRTQIGAAFEQMRRKGVAQGVRRYSFFDAGRQSVATN